ncbi:unnamed protein product [Ascophyllum nodosum]
MAPPKIQPRGGGGSGGRRVYSSNKTASKKTTPRQGQKHKQQAGPRSSPRLPLTKNRGQRGPRFAGYEKRQANGHQQRRTTAHGGFAETKSGSGARGGSSATPSRRRATVAEVASPPTNEESKKAQEEGANVVQELQRELVGAAQSVVDEAEAECEAMFASALEGCSVWTATREKDDELELTALREMESKETSVISRSSELLREIETNRKTLSQMTERFVAALDGVVHAESRRVKTSLDRIMGEKN